MMSIRNDIRTITYMMIGLLGLILMIPSIISFKVALVIEGRDISVGELISDIGAEMKRE